MRNAGKVVQGASLYVFGRITEAEQKMVQKAKALAKATARAIRPVLWRRSTIKVSICARSFGEPDFFIWKAGKTCPRGLGMRSSEHRFADARAAGELETLRNSCLTSGSGSRADLNRER